MIAAVMLRHYKNYENVNFLPISDNVDCKYTVYVGNNGVGKSGILESLDELLKLENNEMQMLLNKNLLNEIEQILTKKQDGVGNKSIVKQINEYLDKFIEQVNEAISAVDESYSFSTEENYKKSLTAKDIREKILEAYFPLRVLKRNGRKISQLSSGEQRKALIDKYWDVP